MMLSTGDLVTTDDDKKPGMIVSVMPSNHDDRMANVFPYVYYVFFVDGGVVGPLFGSEIRRYWAN